MCISETLDVLLCPEFQIVTSYIILSPLFSELLRFHHGDGRGKVGGLVVLMVWMYRSG